jgi:predicted aspartyl protease
VSQRTLELPVEAQSGYVLVPVNLWGPDGTYDANLILDTGAATTTLSSSLARRLGYSLENLPTESAPTANGQGKSFLMKLNRLSMHGADHSSVPARFMEITGVDGLLGNDLLKLFNVLVVLNIKGKSAKLVFRD